MSWLVLAVGAVLALVGGYEIVSGVPYIRMEFGWTEVIAGTVALSGGVVTMALAAVLVRLGSIRDGLARIEPVRPGVTLRPAVLAEDEGTLALTELPAAPAPKEPPAPAAAAEAAPARGSLFRRFGGGRRAAATPDRRTEVAFAPASRAGSEMGGRLPGEAPGIAPPISVPPHGEPEEGAVQAPPLETEPPSPRESPMPPPDEGHEQAIVGRYEAGGAFYVLFADGTIEVTKGETVRRFASMDELRSFVERQENAEPSRTSG